MGGGGGGGARATRSICRNFAKGGGKLGVFKGWCD